MREYEDYKAIQERIGTIIRGERSALGWSQSDLAARAGIDELTLRTYEKGGAMKVKSLVHIANALGLTFLELVD